MDEEASPLNIAEVLAREPLPVLNIEGLTTRRLSDREVQIVRSLVKIFRAGFADKTMADLAVGSESSLRSLYRLAPSRTELVLLVMNQSLRTMAHESRRAASGGVTPLDAVAKYVHRTASSTAKLRPEHARDLAAIPEVSVLVARYSKDRVGSLDLLLQEAVRVHEIPEIDTRAFAVAVNGFIAAFTGTSGETQKSMVHKVDRAVAVLLTGLVNSTPSDDGVWAPLPESS